MNGRVAAWLPKVASNPQAFGVPSRPGYCLAFVRIVVEAAVFTGHRRFYDRWLVTGSTRRPGSEAERLRAARIGPWAVDMEASMKRLGFAVPFEMRQPGDLVFNHNAAKPMGHVALLLSRDVLVEQVNPAYRPASLNLPGFDTLSVTRYGAWPVTLVARLRE